ncbi:MAG: tetratricopeptide repeat protein [Myxococcales bacterium]|jgi:predicted Zn-dependent protease|nr:tetratricopeptide repeat protein [Myxococcales bacterium]
MTTTNKRLAALEKMVAAGPKDPFPYYGLALEYRSADRKEDALAVFAKMREQFASYVPQYLMAGQMLIELGRKDEAKQVLQAGVDAARSARDSHAAGELESALAGLS